MSSFIKSRSGHTVVVNDNPPRKLDISGSGVTVTDDPADNTSIIVITGGGGPGGGEANTASNSGTAGIGLVLTKSGVNLPFKSIEANSTKIAVTDDTVRHAVAIDVNQGNLSLNLIGGTAAYSQLNLFGSVVNSDVSNSAAIGWSKLSKSGSNLTDIANVVITSPSNGQSLTYSSGNWVNATVTGGGGSGGSLTGIGGTNTQSGNASTTVFTIPHGLASTPNIYFVSASSKDAAADFYTTVDATNLTITYPFSPSSGTNNLTWDWMAMPITSVFLETKGSNTQSGNASTNVFTITHGLGSAPNYVSVIPSSADAVNDFYVTASSTLITITYSSPPPSGTNNLSWWWRSSG
jgi:hypothetical protein